MYSVDFLGNNILNKQKISAGPYCASYTTVFKTMNKWNIKGTFFTVLW